MYSLSIRRSTQGLIVALATGVLLFASVAPALASDSTSGGYKPKDVQALEQVQGVGGAGDQNGPGDAGSPGAGNKTAASSGAGNGTLPFTGFEAGLILAVGLGLAGLGLGLRRVSRETA